LFVLLQDVSKYTPAGETITVSAQDMAETWELCVSNTGVEIPETEYERIFDKFYHIPNHDPWKHGGTGLGLALVKKLTACLSSQTYVASGGGQTTFVQTFKYGSAAAD
jgi:signal transduction histidine kinase